MVRNAFFSLLISLILVGTVPALCSAQPSGVTYYVSSSQGSDAYNGLSLASAFATLNKVNGLNLQPGDQVLLKCGDIWRAEQLVFSKSGTAVAPIEFSSYPAGCANKPVLSGARAIYGWTLDTGNIYRADLSLTDFPLGINQLFRNGQRLLLGRWPNIDAPSAGYSFVDAHSAGSNQFTDNEIPALDWTGAVVHIKNIRWSMLDRQVTSSSGHTLVLNQGLSCLVSGWADCTDWGFFINNHRSTLDQDGEWFYDANTRRVYLYSSIGLPSNMEGSVIQEVGDTLRQGGVMLSNGAATAYIILDNIEIKDWFNHGIGTPGGMNGDIYHHLTLQNLTIKDVDGAGVNLSSWLERPSDGRKGLRGGYHLVFLNNTIDGANAFGITGYFAQSVFKDNTIRNIALIKNLGKSGMSCGLTTPECTENGDGFRIRAYDVQDSGFGNTLRYNTFEKIGYNGIDVFGPETTLERNFITQACYTKADCGGVRVFGGNSLALTSVYNIHLIENIIVDIPGNVDGCHPSRAAFGMGLYVDNFSRDVETRGNTVINTTISGILYQQSTGVITGNTIYNASYGTEFSAQIDIGGSESRVSLSKNVLYGLKTNAWTLYVYTLSNIGTSDLNYFFHPYITQQIGFGSSWTRQTLLQWKSLSGKDSQSKQNWFTQPAGEESRARVLYNASKTPVTFDLGCREYLDLDQNVVSGAVTLPSYASAVLVDNGPAPIRMEGIFPSIAEQAHAADFNLTITGKCFTTSSVVRWNGSDRPTIYQGPNQLAASIYASDVNQLGQYAVTVRDPFPAPGGTVSGPAAFLVVKSVYQVFLPKSFR